MSKKLNTDSINKVNEDNTVVEIKAYLDDNNIDYGYNARKRELLKLVENNNKQSNNIKPKNTVILAHKVRWKGHKAGDRVSVTNKEYKYLYKRNMIKKVK